MKVNYRKISALFPKKYKKYYKLSLVAYYLRNLMLFALILIAFLQIQMLIDLKNTLNNTLLDKEAKIADFKYWDNVSGQFPNIPDVLYNTALSALNLGKPDIALQFIEKALRVDPLFEEALKLREEILKG